MSGIPLFKRIATGHAQTPAAQTQLLLASPVARRPALMSSQTFESVDVGNRWNPDAIAVGAHARTGAARIDRLRRRRCRAQAPRSGRRCARRARPLWLMKRRPRHRRFCSIRARRRP
jgi:hypothetical protein